MDQTDPNITFDKRGFCNHCLNYYKNIEPYLKNEDERIKMLNRKIDEIKNKNKNKEFDCVIGLSGGVDSSYMLHLAVTKYKLRPLVFHVDAGWNSIVAIGNIENWLIS